MTIAPPRWAEKYIGGSFEKFGDCVGLCQLVMREQTGIEVSRGDLYDGNWRTADVHTVQRHVGIAPWTRVILHGQERVFDWALLWAVQGSRIAPLHVGIVTAPGWLLHVQEDVAATQQRIGQLAGRVILFARHDKLP